MKKTLFSLFTAVSLALLYCPAAFALTEDEAAAAVDAQGKDAVSGNLFLWLLCAIAFLKVATKLDGILHSLGIGVSRSPGSMLSEALLAFRGFEIGKAFMGLGAAKAAASTATAKATPSNTFAGGLSGMVSRHVQQSTASSISGQSGGIGTSLGGAMYHNSLGKDSPAILLQARLNRLKKFPYFLLILFRYTYRCLIPNPPNFPDCLLFHMLLCFEDAFR